MFQMTMQSNEVECDMKVCRNQPPHMVSLPNDGWWYRKLNSKNLWWIWMYSIQNHDTIYDPKAILLVSLNSNGENCILYTLKVYKARTNPVEC